MITLQYETKTLLLLYVNYTKPKRVKMGRSRYKIYEPTHPHFVTCTILHWLPIFTRKESVAIILDSLKHLQRQDNLKLYAYVILENHLHMIVQSDDLQKSMESFKKYTAVEILKLLHQENVTTLLDQLAFYKKAHRKEKTFQVWEEGYQPKLPKSVNRKIQ
ncbi:MAG: transposase [Campylobacterales bacterium]|nr:transposase [Campylobacterales bacterium]